MMCHQPVAGVKVKNFWCKFILGYLPVAIMLMFIYLPGLGDFCSRLVAPERTDIIGGNRYFSTSISIRFKAVGIEYCLAFDWVSLICIGLGLVLLVVGLYHVKLWIPAAEN